VLDIGATNLDLVRSILAAHERGDYSSADWADPDIEYVIADGPDPGVWTGRAAMAKAWGDVLSAYSDYRTVVDEVREIDEERVLVLGSFGGRGKASGIGSEGMRTGQACGKSATARSFGTSCTWTASAHSPTSASRSRRCRRRRGGGPVDLRALGRGRPQRSNREPRSCRGVETPLSSVSGEPYRGYAGIEQWLRDIDEQFAEWRFRIDEMREVSNAVLAIVSSAA